MNKFESCYIIDDDELFRFNAKKLMNEIGFCNTIFSFHDGQAAVDSLIGFMLEGIKLPEVIFLDLNMPRKNGWEFLKDFGNLFPLEKQKKIKIYIVSSYTSSSNMTKAKSYVAVEDFLVKPLKIETLQGILEKAISS